MLDLVQWEKEAVFPQVHLWPLGPGRGRRRFSSADIARASIGPDDQFCVGYNGTGGYFLGLVLGIEHGGADAELVADLRLRRQGRAAAAAVMEHIGPSVPDSRCAAFEKPETQLDVFPAVRLDKGVIKTAHGKKRIPAAGSIYIDERGPEKIQRCHQPYLKRLQRRTAERLLPHDVNSRTVDNGRPAGLAVAFAVLPHIPGRGKSVIIEKNQNLAPGLGGPDIFRRAAAAGAVGPKIPHFVRRLHPGDHFIRSIGPVVHHDHLKPVRRIVLLAQALQTTLQNGAAVERRDYDTGVQTKIVSFGLRRLTGA